MYCETCQKEEGTEFHLYTSVFTTKQRRTYGINVNSLVKRIWLCAECRENVKAEVTLEATE